ncbi:uncharacterized protein LOC107043012 [Diachasma alloeum]|uniref:uncharacterized protein LOC107043012 n=1 Tax=Diachasma alloeum TaxID=454923 RepID=UPI00073810A8|nr:uncharacterized protein LOC107043012 [Diachasma alloeum]
MKPKSKSKRSVRKFGRLKINQKEEPPSNDDGIDLSNLRKPITTSLSSLRQVAKLFDNGNHEVKSILDYECEVIYECRICRSLFRSLANFISHKRVYCRAKFDISMDRSAIDPHGMPILIPNITPPAFSDTESKENCTAERSRSRPGDAFSRKDLTSVVAMLQQRHADPQPRAPSPLRIVADTEQVLLEVLESNKVAYQTVLEPTHREIDPTDLMKAQANEVQNILSRDTAVLGPDGHLIEVNHLEKPDSPLQFHDHPEDSLSSTSSGDTNLTCSVCDAKFATKKTLTFHMKSLHTPHRMVYPCPCCESLFTNPWGVYRHLYKIHRKSNDQVRKLRPQIQEKAYRTEATRAQDIEKDCANSKLNNNHETTVNETEEWMAHLESDGELQRCGGCGKRFDRKAALLSHSQICQKRIAACSDGAARARRQQKASEIVLETSTSSPITTGRVPVPEGTVSVKDIIPKVVKEQKEEVIRLPNLSSAVTLTRLGQDSEIGIRVEGVSSLSKDAWDKIGSEAPEPGEGVGAGAPGENGVQGQEEMDDDPEIIFTKIEKSQEATVENADSRKRKVGAKERQRNPHSSLLKRSRTPSLKDRSAPSETARPISSRVKAIERRIATIADLQKLRCLPCNKKFSSMAHLRRHMAIHINWNRYRCKVCGFKCYEKVDCVAHCNMAHDAKNNRTAIAGMMAEIQPDDNNASAAGRSLLKKPQGQPKGAMDLEVIDVTRPNTTSDDIANANEEIDCIQNGDSHPKKSAPSPDSEDRPEDSSERSKRVKLDEDPELRRMVMEVIFGSSEGSSSSSEQSLSSAATPKAVECGISLERSTSSSPTSIEPRNPSPKATESPKNEDKVQRPTRNRSKVIDKDFIYDLDAVLMQEPVMMEEMSQSPETSLKVTNDKKRSSIDIRDFKESDDLTVVLYTGDDVDSKIQEIPKTNIIVCDK